MERTDFLFLSGTAAISGNKKCKFDTLSNNNNNDNFTSLWKPMYITNPNYNLTFKQIFTENNTVDNKSGINSLMAFFKCNSFP